MLFDTKRKYERSGNVMISCLVSLMSITIVLSIVVCMMSARIANEAAIRMENSMSAATLAGLSVDFEKYAETYLDGNAEVVVADENESYELFKELLNINLSDANGFIKNVVVNKYIIYNYVQSEGMIYIFCFDNNCLRKVDCKTVGQVFTPNGIEVRKTSVFADVSFDLSVFGNLKFNCHKQLLSSAEKK